jgi:hypothetical protein
VATAQPLGHSNLLIKEHLRETRRTLSPAIEEIRGPDDTQVLSKDHEFPEPSSVGPQTLKQAGRTTFVRYGPGREGNILCGRRSYVSIRWIVYELGFRKVDRGPNGQSIYREGSQSETDRAATPCAALPMGDNVTREGQRLLLTTRLFFTSKTLGTVLARTPAIFLSVSLSTTPSRVTCPFFTMI